MVMMNDIIAFLEKAMEKNLEIQTLRVKISDKQDLIVMVYLNKDRFFKFSCYFSGTPKSIRLEMSNFNNGPIIEISDEDASQFEKEFDKVQKYSESLVLNYFNKYYKELL